MIGEAAPGGVEGGAAAGDAVVLWASVAGLPALAWLLARARRPPAPAPLLPLPPGAALLGAGGGFLLHLFAGQAVLERARWAPVAIAAAVVGALAIHARALRPAFRAPLAPWRRAAAGVVVFLGALPVVTALAWLMERLALPLEQPQVAALRDRKPGYELLALHAVLVAPLLEEVVFRGSLFPALRARMGARGAALATSALFGAVHVVPGTMAPLAAFGLFLAWSVERTGSLLVPVVAHAAFNALTVCVLLV